jgi:hypothetical protein
LCEDASVLEKAKDDYEQVLEIRKEQLCASHVDVADDKLGEVCHDTGELEKGKDYCERAL